MRNEGATVSQSLRCVAGRMSKWHKEVVGELEGHLRKAKSDLEKCMCAPVSETKIREEARLRCGVEELEEKKKIKAKQRSHVTWLRDGNRSTKYLPWQMLDGRLIE